MTVPKIDDQRWPLVAVDWIGEASVDEIDAHFQQMLALTRREGRFAAVIDMRDVRRQTTVQRQRAARHLNTMAAQARSSVICVAHVVSSSLERGILTALYWLSPPPFETKIFTKRDAAEAWALEKLGAESRAVAS